MLLIVYTVRFSPTFYRETDSFVLQSISHPNVSTPPPDSVLSVLRGFRGAFFGAFRFFFQQGSYGSVYLKKGSISYTSISAKK